MKIKVPTSNELEKAKAESKSAYYHAFIIPNDEDEIPSIETLRLYGTKNLEQLDIFLEQQYHELASNCDQARQYLKCNEANRNIRLKYPESPDSGASSQLLCTLGSATGGRLGQFCDKCCPLAEQIKRRAYESSTVYFQTQLPRTIQPDEIGNLLKSGKAILKSAIRQSCSKETCPLGNVASQNEIIEKLRVELERLEKSCATIMKYRARLDQVPRLDLPIFVDNRDKAWLSQGDLFCLFVTTNDKLIVEQLRQANPKIEIGKGIFILGSLKYVCREPSESSATGDNSLIGTFYATKYSPLDSSIDPARHTTISIEPISIQSPFLLRADELQMFIQYPDAVEIWADTNFHFWNTDKTCLQSFCNYFHSLSTNQ